MSSDNYGEQRCDANAQMEDVYWEELLTWLNTSCGLLECFCYVTEALLFPCYVTRVKWHRLHEKNLLIITMSITSLWVSFVNGFTLTYVTKKFFRLWTWVKSQGYPFSVPHLGTTPVLYSGCPECDCFWSYSVSPGKCWANVSIAITMVYCHFRSCGVRRCTPG